MSIIGLRGPEEADLRLNMRSEGVNRKNCPIWNHKSSPPPGPLQKKLLKRSFPHFSICADGRMDQLTDRRTKPHVECLQLKTRT